MPSRRNCLLLIILAVGVSEADNLPRLEVDAGPALVSIKPLPVGRKLVRLGTLNYKIQVNAHCGGAYLAESVSISIADTRKTLLAEELEESSELVTNITIPARQVAPLPVDGFCSATNTVQRELLVHDVVTAHLSLRCTSEQGESITYATRPLAVTIRCETGDQEDSASSILR